MGTRDGSLRAVLLSHTHPDHCGLADVVTPDVPVFCGAAAQRVWNDASFFVPRMAEFQAAGYFTHGVPIVLGPFRVTPWLVDHSGYDAYSLTVEAGGRRLLYSGDVRAHGRKPRSLDAIAAAAIGTDVLLLEGTRIDGDAVQTTEIDVERRVAALLRSTPAQGLAFFSAMNIDRLVSLYRAARRAGRTFVMDLYTATVARATGNLRIAQATWNGVRVYVPNAQRRRVIASGEYNRVDAIRSRRIYPEEIERRPHAFLMSARTSLLHELGRVVDGAVGIWSMWRGYLERSPDLVADLRARGVTLHRVHASGHASRGDLASFAAAVSAGVVVPVHTRNPRAFVGAVANVRLHDDGDWWSV